jgi:hypothetical protein
MSTQEASDRLELPQGTLDLLLPALIFGSRHDRGFARTIQQTSRRARVGLRQMGNLSK